MRPFHLIISLLVLVLVTSCAEEGQYPVSGEECSPDDPVLNLDAPDCLPPL